MATEQQDIPRQVRVRTDPDEGYAYRYDAIEAASEYWNRNKTDAIVWSCEAVGDLLPALEEALENPRLADELAEEIAADVSRSVRDLDIEVKGRDVSIRPD